MIPLQEVQDIGKLRPFGMNRILPCIMMETTTVEDSEDQENLKALKNCQMCMTQEGYPYGTWQTMEAVNTREQGVSEKDRNMESQKLKVFVKKTQRQEISVME